MTMVDPIQRLRLAETHCHRWRQYYVLNNKTVYVTLVRWSWSLCYQVYIYIIGILMGISAPVADRPYLNLAVRSNEPRNVCYEVQV